jgi:hypothetical protein
MIGHPMLAAARRFAGPFALAIVAGCSMSNAATDRAPAEARSPGPVSCQASRAELKARITALSAAQTTDGGIVFSERDAWLETHPLLATLGYDACRGDHDVSTLGGIYDLASKHAAHVLAKSDSDGDFVLERTSWAEQPANGSIEDVGYNALFALDLLNLSRIGCTLRRPIDALYWYQGTRTIANALVQQTFDSRARFFFPMNNATGRRESLYFGLSVMPTLFTDLMGPDVSRSILERYLLEGQTVGPETPHHYLQARGDSLAVTETEELRIALLLAALDHSGLTAASVPADMPPRGDYLSCLIASGEYRGLFPKHYEMTLLEAVCGLTLVMPEESLAELSRNLATVREFLDAPADATRDLAPVRDATRQVYYAISSLREKWRTRSLFTPRDRARVPGFDPYATFDEVLQRVVVSLQSAETAISRTQAAEAGLVVTSEAVTATVVPGEPARFRVSVRADGRPVDIRSIVMGYDESSETLFSTPSSDPLQNGQSRDYWHQRVSAANPGTIDPMRFWSEVQLFDGKKFRYHVTHGVYVTHPVTYSVSFPEGRTLRTGAVPVDIEITKHVDRSYRVTAEWYSPAGLKPIEGTAFALAMTDKTKTGNVRLRVPVPTPCRPGGFPFLVKIYGNDEDWGSVSGNLFKHYQWIFVGPFPKKDNAMSTAYPPERGINLRERYPGVVHAISWGALPARAYNENGEIDLTSLLPRESVGYLHTVIETSIEKQTTVWLSSGMPAIVFINGREVIRNDRPSLGAPQRAVAKLNRGMNNILIKLADGDAQRLFFQLGDADDLTSDEFNNNLWDLVDGFAEFYEKSQDQYGDTGTSRIVTFTYRDGNANSVSVIGSFNGWSPANATMRQGKPGQWEISLHLPPGRYAYRFLINNNTQIVDPVASLKEPDGYGGQNSVLYVR